MVGFFIILGVCGLLAKLVDGWLRKSEKDKLKEKLTRISQRIDNSNLTSVSQAPLHVFSLILDTILGDKLFTAKALRRTATLSTCLMVVSLSIGAISTKTPLGIKTWPWASFDEQLTALAQIPNSIDQTIHNQKQLAPRTLELFAKYKSFILGLSNFNTTAYKIIYSICTIILTLLVCIVIYILSLAISRMMVRHAMEVKTSLNTFLTLFFSLFLGIIAEPVSFVLIGSAAYPLAGLSFGYVSYLLVAAASTHIFNIILLTTLLVISAGLTTLFWFLGPFWIRILAVVTILPMICLIFILFISWLLFPLRKHIRSLLRQGLLRAREHEKGILVLMSITFCCIAGIAVAIAKLF